MSQSALHSPRKLLSPTRYNPSFGLLKHILGCPAAQPRLSGLFPQLLRTRVPSVEINRGWGLSWMLHPSREELSTLFALDGAAASYLPRGMLGEGLSVL